MVVSDIMTSDVISVDMDATVADVVALMHDNDFRHVPVIADRQLIGMISDRDLRSYTMPTVDLDSGTLKRRNLQVPVGDVMNTDTLKLGPEADLSEVIDMMLEQKVGAVPVVETHSDTLLGIVSYVDVLEAARDRL
ncbi:MAG: CBS domain-containing protein [Myxococcales bacterium]|nr:CBS domain-containing protein [Myxococcales bacterium]